MKFSIKTRAASLILAAVLLGTAGCSAAKNESGTSQAASSKTASSKAVLSTVAPSSSTTRSTVRVLGLKGPTGLSMVKLMNDSELKRGKTIYAFALMDSPDAAAAKIVSGETDVAAVPTNLAAALYNKTSGKVQLAAVTTLGVLSVVTNGEKVSSVQDLKGKSIVTSGKGAVPEYALNYILKQNGIDPEKDVKIEYKAQHAETASALLSGKAKIAVLPEPFVTQVTVKNKNVKVALNLTEAWNKASKNASVLTMGCLVVRKDFAEKNKAAFEDFLKDYKASAEYTNSSVADAAKLSEKYKIMNAAVAAKAIPNCSIVYMDGAEMKTKVPDFLKILYQANPKSVGGKLPGEDFYFKK